MAAHLVLNRKTCFGDFFCKYKVILDDNVIGKIKRGQRQEYTIAPGTHKFRVKYFWTSSKVFEFTVEDGGIKQLTCQNNFPFYVHMVTFNLLPLLAASKFLRVTER